MKFERPTAITPQDTYTTEDIYGSFVFAAKFGGTCVLSGLRFQEGAQIRLNGRKEPVSQLGLQIREVRGVGLGDGEGLQARYALASRVDLEDLMARATHIEGFKATGEKKSFTKLPNGKWSSGFWGSDKSPAQLWIVLRGLITIRAEIAVAGEAA